MCIITTISGCAQKKEVIVATCPTFEDMLYQTDFIVRKTQSTSQSLQLLKLGYVDYVLGGRTSKPGEIYQEYKILGSGYSFLHKESKSIFDKDLQVKVFYTDLDKPEDIKEIFGIRNLKRVENIYDYVENNIIITSWDNTDYNKADIVHVLNTNGERYIQSRIPILYCREECDDYIISKINKILSHKYQENEI